jgi:hypothetical protein
MSPPRHAPGPYSIALRPGRPGRGNRTPVTCAQIMAPGRKIADLAGAVKIGDELQPENMATATLFRAAPALLAAAKAMVEAEDALLADLRAAGEHPELTEKPWTLVDGLRAAIADAEAAS